MREDPNHRDLTWVLSSFTPKREQKQRKLHRKGSRNRLKTGFKTRLNPHNPLKPAYTYHTALYRSYTHHTALYRPIPLYTAHVTPAMVHPAM